MESKAVQELRELHPYASRNRDIVEAVIAELEAWTEAFGTSDPKVATKEFDEAHRQLAAVTEDRGKWEAVAKANQDEIDRFQKQLTTVTSELEVTSKHRDNAVDELRYGAIETVKQLDAVSEKVINDLKAQLAAVTAERDRLIELVTGEPLKGKHQ